MKYTLQKGTFKRSKYIFIFTGVFLIALFGYQLYDHLQSNDFIYEFPGDWDKVLGMLVGLILILRSSIFTVRSRDLFIEITDAELKYRINRTAPVKQINRSDIDKLEVKKGQVIVFPKESERISIVDLSEMRIRDERKREIIEGLKASLKS